jgi:CheY-like chemotaxis protein
MTTPREPVHLLLVEDDVVDVMNVRRAFDKGAIGDPLHVVSSGVEALALLRGPELPSDRSVVLLDLNLPMMNGIELLRALRSDVTLRALPVVVLTTSDEARDRAATAGLDVAGYLVKPLLLDDFCALMRSLVARWGIDVYP